MNNPLNSEPMILVPIIGAGTLHYIQDNCTCGSLTGSGPGSPDRCLCTSVSGTGA